MLNRGFAYRLIRYFADVCTAVASVTDESKRIDAIVCTAALNTVSTVAVYNANFLYKNASIRFLQAINEQGYFSEPCEGRFFSDMGFGEQQKGDYAVASILYRHAFERGCPVAKEKLFSISEKCPADFVVSVNTNLAFLNGDNLQKLAKDDSLRFAIVTADLPCEVLIRFLEETEVKRDVLEKRALIKYQALFQELLANIPTLSGDLLKLVLLSLIDDLKDESSTIENTNFMTLPNRAMQDKRLEQFVSIAKRPKSIWKEVLNREIKEEKRAEALGATFPYGRSCG